MRKSDSIENKKRWPETLPLLQTRAVNHPELTLGKRGEKKPKMDHRQVYQKEGRDSPFPQKRSLSHGRYISR